MYLCCIKKFSFFVAECQWLHLEFIKTTLTSFRDLFPAVKYGFASVPSYPSGQLGFIVASTSKVCECSVTIYLAQTCTLILYTVYCIHFSVFIN